MSKVYIVEVKWEEREDNGRYVGGQLIYSQQVDNLDIAEVVKVVNELNKPNA